MRWRGGYKDRGRGYEEGEGKICGVEKRYDRVGGGAGCGRAMVGGTLCDGRSL